MCVCVFSASRYFILIGHHRFMIEYDIASLTGVGEHDGNLFPEFVMFLSRAEPPLVAGSSLSNHVDIRFFHMKKRNDEKWTYCRDASWTQKNQGTSKEI